MSRPSILVVLKRGLQKKCPHCGKQPVFIKWIDRNETCPECGLVFEEHGGDLWAFWVLGDRVFVIAAVLFAWYLQNSMLPEAAKFYLRAGGLMLIAFGLVATIPNRMGLCIAFDYLLRKKT